MGIWHLRLHSVYHLSCDVVYPIKGSDQSWQRLRIFFLRSQELSTPMCNKYSREGRKPSWLNEDLLVKQAKGGWHRWWKCGRVPWEEYRNTVWMCRDGIRKAKAQMTLARDAKNNKEGFYRYIWPENKGRGESTPSDG